MSSSGIETEVKLRFRGPDDALSALQALGFEISRDRVFEANMVYDTPDNRLRNAGQLLRLRTAGDVGTLTWKGPSQLGVHKTRPEIETPVANAQSCEEILRQLGYTPVFRYEKYRTELKQPAGGGIATVDETPIGCFVELEGPPEWIDTVAARLGFEKSAYITDSYGTLYRKYCETSGLPLQWMVFSER